MNNETLCYILLFFLLSLSTSAEVQFVDATAAAGITFQHVDGRTGEKFLIETLGSGALFLDFNIDGALDLYVVNATHIPPPKNENPSHIHIPHFHKTNSTETTATALLPILQTRQALATPATESDVQPPMSTTTVTPKFM